MAATVVLSGAQVVTLVNALGAWLIIFMMELTALLATHLVELVLVMFVGVAMDIIFSQENVFLVIVDAFLARILILVTLVSILIL